MRCEVLSLLAIKYSIEECRSLWREVKDIPDGKGSDLEFQKAALRLDFTMTFYQLNCLLIDSFYDPDYFARNSKIDVIIDNKPASLDFEVRPELEQKLRLLEIIS